jgi:spore maturation protein CgeB
MKILYIGPERGTSMQRLGALRRLGHDVTVVDSYIGIEKLPLPPILLQSWAFKTGAFGCGGMVRRYVLSKVKGAAFDLVFVDAAKFSTPRRSSN